ncbi:hypothetical protein [Planctobacterium marinum]|uniref:Uncharacterized protein n=1 Tax=Planctobacterium marinum TaxID=1631968 RepID=A0AA48HM59_9ALTE|nr:hypothetical protein MACH26_28670 [Planctobacterium marinum]
MLLAFAEKTLSGLVFSALVVGIASYFGQASIFDPIILICFIAIAIAFRRNIDLVSICSVFIAERALEELMWRFLENTIWFKIPSYFILIIICLFLSNGLIRLYSISFLTLAASIEAYWYFTDYNAPFVIWYCYLLTILIVIRRFLRMRVFWLIEVNPKWSPTPLALDSQLLLANIGFIVSASLMAFEYYVRHLTGFSDLVVVYNIFPYFNHTLSMFMIYMIIVQSIQHLKAIELEA